MAVVFFDTYTWVKRLKAAGFTDEQAETEVNWVAEMLAANIKDLVTKQDLRELEVKLSAMLQEQAAQKADIAWLKWPTGAIAVGLLAQLLRTFGVI